MDPYLPKKNFSGNPYPSLDLDSNKGLACGKAFYSDASFLLSGFCDMSQVFERKKEMLCWGGLSE